MTSFSVRLNKTLRAFLAALAFSGVPAFVCADQITLPSGDGTQSTTSDPPISGGITGANSVLKNSDGEFYLDSTNNTYSGGTSITAGSIKITNNNSIGTGTINIGASGTLNLSFDGVEFTRKVTGSGTVKLTNATVNWSGDVSTFTGTVDMNGRAILFKNTSSSSASATYKNPSIFCLGANISAGMITGGSGNNEIRPSNTVPAGTYTLTVGSDSVADGTFTGKITDHNSNLQAITKTGSNTWTLSGTTFSYSGPTLVKGGKLVFSNSNASLNKSSVTISGGELSNKGTIAKAITMTGGKLTNSGTVPAINVTSGSATIANSGTAGTVTVSSGASLTVGSGTLTDVDVQAGGSFHITGGVATVDLASTASYYLDGLRQSSSASSVITGTGTIYASSTNDSIAFASDVSGFTGTYVIERGYNRGTNLEQSAVNASGMQVILQKTFGSATDAPLLTMYPGTTIYVGMITGTLGEIRPQNVAGVTATSTLVLGNDTAYENHQYDGQINNQATSNLIAVTKTGTNTWTLSNGTYLTYSGATTINGGTLEFTSTAKLPNSQITLTGGIAAKPAEGETPAVEAAPATLKNDGTITKQVLVSDATNAAINNTGTLTGGVALKGASTTLTLDGTVSLNAKSGGGSLTTLNVNSGTTTYFAEEKKVTTINVAKGATLTFDKQNGLGKNLQIANIVLNGGTLKSNYDGYANLGPVTLNGGEITDDSTKRASTDYQNYGAFLFYSGVNVTDDAKITVGKFMIRAAGAADGNVGKFTVAQGKTLTVSSEIRLSDSNGTSTSLEKLGAGTMVLTDTAKLKNCAGSSTLKVSGGTLAVTSLNAEYSGWSGGIPVVMNGGTLELRNTATNAAAFDVKSKVTGTGTISHVTTTKTYTTYPNITGDLSGFTGTFALNGTSAVLRSGQSMANVVFTNPNEFCPVNTQSIALLTGTSGTIRPSTATNTEGKVATLVVGREGAGETGTFAGSIIDFNNGTQFTQAITKTGSNTWVLTGSNLTYTGPTNVNGGILQLGMESIKTNLANSAVTVSGTGTLINYGTIAKAVTVKEGGTYIGMAESKTTTGVTFESGAALAFDLDSWGKELDLTNSSFGLTTVEIFSEEEPESLYEQSFNLFKTNDAEILSKLMISSNVEGLTWIPTYANNLVSVTGYDPSSIPEPATWLLLVLGLGGILTIRKLADKN